MSGKRSRTWISAEISPELMESLERRARVCGISRSEGLRRALRQWAAEGDHVGYTVQERGQRIVSLVDDLREEVLFQLSGESPETGATTERPAEETTAKANAGDSGGHVQMELYGDE